MNKNIKIVADSSSNILELENVDYASVPLHVIVGENDYIDDASVNINEMQQSLSDFKGKTSTSCPSPEEWLAAFGDADIIYCITITSNLSGANSSANIAKQMYEDNYPDKKVYVFDTLSTGPEMALIIDKVKSFVLSGMEPEEIYEKTTEYMKHTHLYFSLASLDNFAKNGRVNPLLAKGIGLFGIRIVGKASEEGTLEPMDKCRGDKKAFPCIIEHMKKCEYTDGKIVLTHTNYPEGAETLKKLITDTFGTFNGYIASNNALCSYYAEPQSLLIGFEAPSVTE